MLRDRIRALAHIQSHQSIALPSIDEADIFAAHAEAGQVCVQVFFLRAGQNLGNRAYFPAHARDLDEPAVLSAFIGQFYEARPAPKLILTSHDVAERELLESALAMTAGHKVEIRHPKRGDQKDALDQATLNAREALARRMAERGTQRQLLEGVARVFGLDGPPERIEIYDNSHIQGSSADRRHGGGRARGLHQEFLSQVQHQDRGRGGRRFRHDARGADAPLRPRAEGRSRARARSIGRTWC